MTRNNEILRAAANNPTLYYESDRAYFVEGAKWADRTMIDKACKWLRMSRPTGVDENVWWIIIDDFRKAMEE